IEGLEDSSDAWTVGYADDKEDAKLNRLELLITKAKDAGSGTHRVYLSINDQLYYYENLEGQDSSANGTVTVKNNGDTGTVTLDVTTQDGSKVKGTVECKRVLR